MSMKNKKNLKTLILLALVISISELSLFITNLYDKSIPYEKFPFSDNAIKISANHAPIHIDGNWYAAKTAGICLGSGSYDDPYIIKDLEINAGGSGSCILIENTDEYFIIANCLCYFSGNANAGITLNNVHNGTLINNDCSDNISYGIKLVNSENNTISGNTANSNYVGIIIDVSNNNTISGNTANNNDEEGISISNYSCNNTISNNTANYNGNKGIEITFYSCNNTISNNTVYDNENIGIYLDERSDGNIVLKNIVNNNLDGIGMFYSCYHNTISKNTANYNSESGIIIHGSFSPRYFNNTISNNTANYNGNKGIEITFYSCNNTISNNIANYNFWAGITIDEECDYNIVSSNNVNYNRDGIYMYYGTENIILDNVANYNSGSGIRLNSYCIYNNISGNTVNDNDGYGLYLRYHCDNNIILGNTINNNYEGIYIFNSDDNNITRNILIDNDYYSIYEDGSYIWNFIRHNICFKINSPKKNDLYGANPPNYNLIIDSDLDKTWYTLDNETTKYIFDSNGTINEGAWSSNGNGTVTINFCSNNTLGDIGFKEVVIGKDIIAPSITINNPTNGEEFGATSTTAPNYNLSIDEGNLDTIWYSINGGNNNTASYLNLINGYLMGMIEQTLWDSLNNGTITIIFYANDTMGNVGLASVEINKIVLAPSGMIKGIDVSHWQNDIDWTKVYDSGYKFAFVKASEGVGWKDSYFLTNIKNGYNAGVLVGAYHYALPSYNNATAEALYFIDVVKGYFKEGYLRPVLDIEEGANLGKEKLSNWIHEWMDTVKNETGIEPILYINSDYANYYLDNSIIKYDLWIAHWTYDSDISPNTGIWDDWDFWQYSDKGSVEGIDGDVDLDLFHGNITKLHGFLIEEGSEGDEETQIINGYELFIFLGSIIGVGLATTILKKKKIKI